MPEGHTIHRIARDHGKLLVGQTVEVTSPQGRFSDDAARVDGATLEHIEPYGKHLFYHWSTGEIGHVHLGLFGKYRVHRTEEPPEPRGAVRMRLRTDGVTVDLSGPTACTVDPPDVRDRIVRRLGPDPLRHDADASRAIEALSRSGRAMAALLLDQSVLAGVGNVYRAEVLFLHGIHPRRPGKSCTTEELAAVWDTSERLLRAGLRAGRIVTVSRDELDLPKGARIPRDQATYVYRRSRCLRCGSAVEAVEVGNRTCYYCPTDQPR